MSTVTDTDTHRPEPTIIRSWLQLFRIPNLLTVPGDPIAGYYLSLGIGTAHFVKLALAAAASLLLYAAGLLLNDLADEQEDRNVAPGRPLPSGRVQRRTVLIVCGTLFVLGFAMCALLGNQGRVIGVALIVLILLYNGMLKNVPFAGELTMGLCRGFSFLLGASQGVRLEARVFVIALIVTIYISVVTALAKQEHSEVRELSAVTPETIGMLVSLMLPIQAGIVLLASTRPSAIAVAVVLLALWPLNRRLAKSFYAS